MTDWLRPLPADYIYSQLRRHSRHRTLIPPSEDDMIVGRLRRLAKRDGYKIYTRITSPDRSSRNWYRTTNREMERLFELLDSNGNLTRPDVETPSTDRSNTGKDRDNGLS